MLVTFFTAVETADTFAPDVVDVGFADDDVGAELGEPEEDEGDVGLGGDCVGAVVVFGPHAANAATESPTMHTVFSLNDTETP